jgi:hypothetical protein
MLHRLAVYSALALLSLTAFSSKALANVTFTVVPNPGSLSTTTNGTVLESTTAVTVNNTGSAARITFSEPACVSCETADPQGTTRSASLTFNGNTISQPGETLDIPSGQTTVQVQLRVVRPVMFRAGTYTYGVNLRVVP